MKRICSFCLILAMLLSMVSVVGMSAFADAITFTELINALPEEITLADKQVVEEAKAVYATLSAEEISMLDAEILTKYRTAKNIIASLQPYDVSFRTFDKTRQDDLNIEDIGAGVWNAGQKSDIPAQGSKYFYAQALKEAERIMLYVYGHKQNRYIDADGNNEEGCSQIYISDIKDMYISFDFYVSDASVVANPGDAGFGIDTKEGGGSSYWGNTFNIKRSDMLSALKDLKDGWNHIVLPLYWKSVSLGQLLSGQALTVESFRFYMVDIEVPIGFVTGLDDIHFVNRLGLISIDAKRAAAKEITYGIRNFPTEGATVDDFYEIYAVYNTLENEYKDIVLGWDSFVEANSNFIDEAEAMMATNKSAADPVIEAIAALDKEITVDDKDAIEAAEAALAALTENQKVLVNNAYILAVAREAYDDIMQTLVDQEAADAVVVLINNLPEEITVDDKEAIEFAEAAYAALTEDQKALVGNANILTAARKAYEAVIQAPIDQAAAKEVEDLIATIPDQVTLDHKSLVSLCLSKYRDLTDNQKAMVSNYDKLEQARQIIVDIMAAEAEDRAAADKVIELISTLPDTITESEKTLIELCRSKYDGLTPAQQALVSNYDKLLQAERELDVLLSKDVTVTVNWEEVDDDLVRVDFEISERSEVCAMELKFKYNLKHLLWVPMEGDRLREEYIFKGEATIASGALVESTEGDYGGNPMAVFVTSDGYHKGGRLAYCYFKVLERPENGEIPFTIEITNIGHYEDENISYNVTIVPAIIQVASEEEQQQENEAAAKVVVDLIDTLPATITVENKALIELCRAQYEGLTDTQKELVKNFAKLEQAEADLEALFAAQAQDKAAAQPVIDLINTIPVTITKEDQSLLTLCRTNYSLLSDSAKPFVSNYAKLQKAEQDLTALLQKEIDEAAAKGVDTLIAKLPVDITEENKHLVDEAQTAYEALTEAQQLLVTRKGELMTAITAKKVLNLIALINSLPAVITKADADAVAAAREAYDALDATEQAMITNYNALVLAEEMVENLATVTYGDINEDGSVNAKDALLVLKAAVGKEDFSSMQKTAAEVDRKEGINAKDALEILKFAVSKIQLFPVEVVS